MKRFFITGTDTDCGKTYVTAKLIEFFNHSAAIKPIACGDCELIEDRLVSFEAQQLQKNSPLTIDEINPWCFELPVSPHIATKAAGVRLSVTEIADYCLNFQSSGVETLFIEGAGGLMVPLNDEETWIDFLKYTDIPVILVVGVKLGCINHTLLTETALRANQIKCTGWIANCLDPQMLMMEENIATLKRTLKIPLLATIPFDGEVQLNATEIDIAS